MSLARNLCLLFLILFLIIPSCKKEELISTPDFTISLEGEYDDLCTNENDEIMIIGSRKVNNSFGRYDLVILKTNSRAQIIWEKVYKIEKFIKPCRIVSATSGDYFIAIQELKNFATFYNGIKIFQINEEGEILHECFYEGAYFSDMVANPDGGIILCGYTDYEENPGLSVKINSNCEQEYIHEFPFKPSQMIQYSTGEICFLEDKMIEEYTYLIHIYLTNAAGDLLSSDTMTQVAHTARYSFSEVPGELLWLIENNDTTNLFKTDFNSNMIWSTEFASPDQEIYAIWDLRKMGEYYYAVGSYYSDQLILCVIKYDENGNKLRTFRNEIDGYSEYSDVQFIEMDNGSLAFIEPVYPDEGCSKWNNCYILQIFK